MTHHRVAAYELQTFSRDIMLAHGVDPVQAEAVSEGLVWGDLVGRPTHGVSRLTILIDRFKRGVLKSPCCPLFEKSADSMELLDGDEGFGHYVASLAMNRAIELASDHGIGVVGVHNSNFFGTAGYFVNQAAQANMVGIALSNSVPNVAAFGGIKPVFGTNPLGFGAPRSNGHHLLLDMATSAWSASAVRNNLKNGKPLPEGTAIDADGQPIIEPRKVTSFTLLPLGGPKGYGLALMIELLCGIITGAGFSHGVASLFTNLSRSGDNGHFMMALDISRWMPLETYHQRMDELVSIIKDTSLDREVFLPGEQRWRERDYNLKNGIALDQTIKDSLLELSQPYSIQSPLKV